MTQHGHIIRVSGFDSVCFPAVHNTLKRLNKNRIIATNCCFYFIRQSTYSIKSKHIQFMILNRETTNSQIGKVGTGKFLALLHDNKNLIAD